MFFDGYVLQTVRDDSKTGTKIYSLYTVQFRTMYTVRSY